MRSPSDLFTVFFPGVVLLLMAVSYSQSTQQEGTDENVWDIHWNIRPLQSSSPIRLDEALEEQELNTGSKSARKKAKTGLVHITSKSCTRSNPGFIQHSPWKRELSLGLGSVGIDITWLRPLRQHGVREPIFHARCSGISCGTNGLRVSQRSAEFNIHSSHHLITSQPFCLLFV